MRFTAVGPGRRRAAARFAAAGLAALVAALPAAATAGAATMPSPFFAKSSFINRRVDTGAFQAAPNSATMVTGLNDLVNGIPGVAPGYGTWVSADAFAYPIYVVDSTIPSGRAGYTPKVSVALTNAAQSPFHVALTSLMSTLGGVPMPTYAQPATGNDQIIDVYDKGTDTFYEFWHFCPKNPAGVDPTGGNYNIRAACLGRAGQAALVGKEASAEAGGIVQHASQSSGYFSDRSYPGFSWWDWGSLGSDIVNVAGEATIAELKSGRINHAVATMLPSASGGLKDSAGHLLYHGTFCTGKWTFPAQKLESTYGTNTAADCIPEGTRLKLNLTNTQINALDLTPVERMYALAAAHYGIVVRERDAHAPAFERESPWPIFWKACPTGVCNGTPPINPYTGHPFGDTSKPTATSIFAGYKPWQLMQNFPWTKMQVEKPVTCTIPQGGCPTVSVSAPAWGATATGTVTVKGRQTPNVHAALAGVRFQVDGKTIGAEDTTAPYSVSWDTSQVTPGTHVLTAVTRDPSNHLSHSPAVTITVK